MARTLRAKPGGPPADNSRCFVCHATYEEEKFAVAHAKGGYGCVKCHGESDAHCSDEDNLTAPEIMYHWRKVSRACIACHEVAEVLAVEKHKPELPAIALEEKVCTDCHTQHRLPRRNRKWDRETGVLLPLPAQQAVAAKPNGGAAEAKPD